jgi:hypothetical protein
MGFPDARWWVNLWRTPVGRGSLGLVVLFGFVAVMYLSTDSEAYKTSQAGDDLYVSDRKEIEIMHKVARFSPDKITDPDRNAVSASPPVRSGPPKPLAGPGADKVPAPGRSAPPAATRAPVLPIALYTAPVDREEISTSRFAPYGRLLICELVNTIDSARINTPVIGLVTEDIYHDGELVIPAATEVHGWAAKSSLRDRIAADGTWKFVWRDTGMDSGKELSVRALALNYTKVPGEMKWDITDGSAGLKGYVVNENDWDDLVAIAAVFLSGVGEGMVKTETVYGTGTSTVTTGGTSQDMFGKGMQKAASLYAQRMLEAIERDGAFVRVPAGTMFYLYVLEPIDMSKAKIGEKPVKTGEKEGR